MQKLKLRCEEILEIRTISSVPSFDHWPQVLIIFMTFVIGPHNSMREATGEADMPCQMKGNVS